MNRESHDIRNFTISGKKVKTKIIIPYKRTHSEIEDTPAGDQEDNEKIIDELINKIYQDSPVKKRDQKQEQKTNS